MTKYHIYDESGHHHQGPIQDEDKAFRIRDEHNDLYDGSFYVKER